MSKNSKRKETLSKTFDEFFILIQYIVIQYSVLSYAIRTFLAMISYTTLITFIKFILIAIRPHHAQISTVVTVTISINHSWVSWTPISRIPWICWSDFKVSNTYLTLYIKSSDISIFFFGLKFKIMSFDCILRTI